jgi:hypothetical protein
MFSYSKQPLSIPGIIAGGWRLYCTAFKHLVFLGLLAGIVASGQLILQASHLVTMPAPSQTPGEAMSGGVTALIVLLLDIWMLASIFALIGKTAINEPTNVGKALLQTLRRYPIILIAGILSGLMVVLGTIAFFLPGVILMVYLVFVFPLLVIDKKGIFSSIGNSFKLATGSWWHTFFTLLFPTIVILILLIPIELPLLMHAKQATPTPPSWGIVIYNILLITFAIPCFYSIVVVLFNNVKLRKKLSLERKALKLKQGEANV